MAEYALAYGIHCKAGTPEPIAKFANMLTCAVRWAGLTCPSAAVHRPSADTARHRRPDDAAARLPSRTAQLGGGVISPPKRGAG